MTLVEASIVHRPLRVLVVEDESRMRDFLVDMIHEMGFEVRGAKSGEEALDRLDREPADILLLDLRLPAMSGIELLEAVKARRPATQAIILTAHGDLSAAQRAIRLRVAEFLTKPFHLADIESALDRARRLAVEARQAVPDRPTTGPGSASASAKTLDEAERQLIAEALARNAYNKAATARELGISRRSLYDRLGRTEP